MNEISQGTRNRGKRSTAVSSAENVGRDARASGTTVNRAVEDGVTRAVIGASDADWVARNPDAMASYDAFVETEGLILGHLRTFDH